MITLKVEGLKECAAALAELSTRLSKRILIDALTEGAEPMRKSARAHAKRRSPAPDLADHIGVGPANYKGEQATVKVGPTKGFGYGLPLEVGTVDTAAQPFMRPAFDEYSGIDKTPKIVGEVIWLELAGRGISRPTAVSDEPIGDLGLTRTQATTKAAFKGKQRPYVPRKPRATK